MEGLSGLSELSVISWVSAIHGCPLSGVPLYIAVHIVNCLYVNHLCMQSEAQLIYIAGNWSYAFQVGDVLNTVEPFLCGHHWD